MLLKYGLGMLVFAMETQYLEYTKMFVCRLVSRWGMWWVLHPFKNLDVSPITFNSGISGEVVDVRLNENSMQ